MSYIQKNEKVVIDLTSALNLLNITNQEFFNDIENYKDSYKGSKKVGKFGFKDFKQKYQLFFDLRKIRSPASKMINSKSSLDGLLRLLTNENYYSSIQLIKDFQENARESWLNVDFIKVVKYLHYHKKLDIIKHLTIPYGFSSKLSYDYEYREKKIGFYGFLNKSFSHLIDNWNIIKDYINIDLNIIWNKVKKNLFAQLRVKYMCGFRLRIETLEVDNNGNMVNYQDNVKIGVKTKVCNTQSVLIREISEALKRLETNILSQESKSRIPKYHIYVSEILFTQYTI